MFQLDLPVILPPIEKVEQKELEMKSDITILKLYRVSPELMSLLA